MLTRDFARAVLLALLTVWGTIMFLSTELTEAEPLEVIYVTQYWTCIRKINGEVCDTDSREYTDKDEPFLHWINPFAHPHSTYIDYRTDVTYSLVGGCSTCKTPWEE